MFSGLFLLFACVAAASCSLNQAGVMLNIIIFLKQGSTAMPASPPKKAVACGYQVSESPSIHNRVFYTSTRCVLKLQGCILLDLPGIGSPTSHI